jgi:putative multiple sugar transport system substrate-binding protein
MVAAGIAVALSLAACGGTGAGGANGGGTPAATGSAGATGGTAAGAGALVGVAMPTQTSERWINDGNAVKEALEKDGYTVDLKYANDDIPTQTQQIDAMITEGAKLLIIASIDGTALTSQLENAASKGIKVIAYDRLINGTPNVDFYTTFDNYAVGVAQANALLYGLGLTDKDGKAKADAPKGPFNIEVFAGSPDDNNAKFFFNGGMDTLKPFIANGTLVIKSGQTSFDQVAILRWSQDGAQQRMENLLTSTYSGGKTLAGVLSPFDGLSRGIITALQNFGMGPTIDKALPIVTGQDAELPSVKAIIAGEQYSTIFKDTRTLAAQAVKVAEAFLAGNTPEANDTKTYNNGVKVVPTYLLPVVTVYKEDIQKQLIDSKYYTADQVAAGVA